ncbi:hypothetical protein K435DRAFT_861249 [Dendrothele bispora CBS 962.96]|uniref:Uncharacterized protein n=1 Tax=Dendrothele bispora (strain CBS 962.96) TaxID=1314807 RepID=A0A4S8LVQ1_DENBC|nr:hypothetical protein K435DRAFT_861249 [Dendrothele bispora CBS 962.96]
MEFDPSSIAGPSQIQLTPPSHHHTLSQIINQVPFPTTTHGGAPMTPSHHVSSFTSPVTFPSTPFHNHGSRRLDRSPRTPATRETIVKRARIVAHASPPSESIRKSPSGSIFDLPPDSSSPSPSHTPTRTPLHRLPQTPTRHSRHDLISLMASATISDSEEENECQPSPCRHLFVPPDFQRSQALDDSDIFGGLEHQPSLLHSPARRVSGVRISPARPLREIHTSGYTDNDHPGQKWCQSSFHIPWVLDDDFGNGVD